MGMHSRSCVPCVVGREGRSSINRSYKGHGVINIQLKTPSDLQELRKMAQQLRACATLQVTQFIS